jgi:MFS family permease
MGYSPTQAGVRMLAWTAMPLVVAPIAGALSDRNGRRPIMAFGLTLDAIAFAWIADIASPTTPYAKVLPAFVLAGIGTAAFFASVANVVMGAVRPEEAGQASGATNAIREIGGVLGVGMPVPSTTASGSATGSSSSTNGTPPSPSSASFRAM